jgi:6-phosphogluconolactonase
MVLAALVVLAAAAAVPAVAGARPGPAGFVYVNDNTSGTNTVAGFARGDDGQLVPLPGSPFDTGGQGTGSGLASQGAIQVSSDGRFVIAVDAGSDQISVLRIKQDGTLELVPHGDVSSGGAEPVSVAEHDGLVYVANAGAGGSNYTGFTLSPSGRLRALEGSTVPLPDDAQPGDVLFTPPAPTWLERGSTARRSTASASVPTGA